MMLAIAAFPALLGARASAGSEVGRLTPVARISQRVGITEISVEYSSPAVQGRRIWGALVPYDRPWEISATHPTTIRFSDDVVIGDKSLAAGTYRFAAIPGKDSWKIILTPSATSSPEAGQDVPAPSRSEPPGAGAGVGVGAELKVPARTAPPRERLTFLFSNFDEEKTSLDLEWDRLRVSIPIATHTEQRMQSEINELENVWHSYANAARYMLETEKDYDAGLKYADQSLALKEDWYTYWIKAALLAAKRDYSSAVEQGERAYDLGRQQFGDNFVLEHDLRQTLAGWKRRVRAQPSAGQ